MSSEQFNGFCRDAAESAAIELSDDAMCDVVGGKRELQFVQTSKPETMQELYQEWADLGNTLKFVYR